MQDKELLLSDKQAITTSAASTNYVEEDANINTGHTMLLEVLATTAFTCATSDATVTIAVQRDTTSDFSDPVDLIEKVVTYSDLTLGKRVLIPIPFDPDDTHLFTRAYYTCSATMTAGAVTAAIVDYSDTNVQ